ncbi:hypothetical protein LPJ66_005087, partial [Kickxella alabastrina]
MKAPSHIDFSTGSHSPRHSFGGGSAPQQNHMQQRLGQQGQGSLGDSRWPPQLYRQWFGAIAEGRSIQVHSILADHPNVLDMRRKEPTPFHMALTHIASEWLGNDTTGMDGLQVAIMGYKNAYANWRLGNGAQSEQMAGMSADQMKEHVAVREVILGALIDAISPEQLDSHFFGRQQNTTLHLASFYNDANLVERLLRQGAAVDISNRMGFLPSGITNDKPTLQWLAMYQGQVRGTRYQTQPSPPQEHMEQQQFYGTDTDDAYGQYDDAPGSNSGILPVSQQQQQNYGHDQVSRVSLIESELQLENISPSNDSEPSESPYVNKFGNRSPKDLYPAMDGSIDYSDHDSVSDEQSNDDHDDDHADNVSVASSNDRHSLGLGGNKTGLAKSPHEPVPLRQRVLDSQLARKDDARSATASIGSNTAHNRSHSPSVSPSVMSYHTAPGGMSDDGSGEQDFEGADGYRGNSATIRMKVDPNTINDNDIDDIFSDTDDIIQMEPSYCDNAAGLSDSHNWPASPRQSNSLGKHTSLTSSMSSSGLITMQSLNKATPRASLNDNNSPVNTMISAFPVVLQDTSMQHPIRESNTKQHSAVEQLKQSESVGKDSSQPPRPASPFLLRDSLYEMIMGRSSSRTSLTSGCSANSTSMSSSSTIGLSREHPTLLGLQPTSPTSPTSMNSQLSPESTTFEVYSTSPPQPSEFMASREVFLEAAARLRTPLESSAVAEDSAITLTEPLLDGLSPVPTTGASHYQSFQTTESELDSVSNSDSDSDSDSEAEPVLAMDDASSNFFDTRASSPVPRPRPSASSLFSFMQDPELVSAEKARTYNPEPVPEANEDEEEEQAEQVSAGAGHEDFPPLADAVLKPGRIGRRQGRATVEMLQDDDVSGFSSEPQFSFILPKLSTESLSDMHGTRKAASEAEAEAEAYSPLPGIQELPSLPDNVPLTRDKRDQYLQTLINRSTMRGTGSSGKPKGKRPAHAAITQAMRAASPAPTFGSASNMSSFDDADDADAEVDHFGMTSGRDSRHSSVRSDGPIDALHLRPTSPHNTREALAVSGASINGRIRSNTMGNLGTPALLAKSITQARKVSPSLTTLKSRSLVSNSTAKLTSPAVFEPTLAEASPMRMASLSNFEKNRSRAMSSPMEPRPQSALSLAGNSARIGRVAALSQNFERQKGALGPPPMISIPGRASTGIKSAKDAANRLALGAMSAPLGGKRMDFGKPTARSNSISSSHDTGAHGQVTTAESLQAANNGENQHEQEPPSSPSDIGAPPGGLGGGRDNGGESGSGESSSNNSVSVLEPISTDSNGSSTSHSSSASNTRGLAASMDQHSADFGPALFDSSELGGQLGSSIFSSVDLPVTGSRDSLPQFEPSSVMNASASSGLHAPVSLRRDSDGSHSNRAKELADRRKSGTLARISNRGLVKNRKALLDSSESSMARSTSPSKSSVSSLSSKSKHNRVHFFEPEKKAVDASSHRSHEVLSQSVSDTAGPATSSFFGQQGEGRSPRGIAAVDDSMSLSLGDAAMHLEESQQAVVSALHPGSQLRNASFVVDSSIGRSGINADELLALSLSTNHRELAFRDLAGAIVSRGSSSGGKSKAGSSSGEDSFHILSSTDSAGTPGSTPLDSVLENTSVGLLAQYASNQKRIDREYTFSSYEPLSAASDGGPESRAMGESSRRANVGSSQGPEGLDNAAGQLDTVMPVRPHYDSRVLFGLSTVDEEDESSRNQSVADSEALAQRGSMTGIKTTMSAANVTAAALAFSQATSSASASAFSPNTRPVIEMQERHHLSASVRGLRSTLAREQHLQRSLTPVYQGLGPMGIPEIIDASTGLPVPESPVRDEFDLSLTGAGLAASMADDDTHSRAPSYGSHSFDANLVFGYTSEENNSTLGSRSSFGRSEFNNTSGPGSSASRVLYMHPIDQPPSDFDGYNGDSETRAVDWGSPATSGSRVGGEDILNSAILSDMGKVPMRKLTEMQQVRPASVARTPEHIATVEELEEDLSPDEEPIPAAYFLESQDFDGYVTLGNQMLEEREERRIERRIKREAAKKGLPPPSPEESPRVMSPLWFVDNSYVDPLPPPLMEMMLNERDQIMPENTIDGRVNVQPGKKRILESRSISTLRLRQELDEFMNEDEHAGTGGGIPESVSRGTIKPLVKRQRVNNISTMFDPPSSAADGLAPAKEAAAEAGGKAYGTRKSFLDSVEIPVSDIESAGSSDASLVRWDSLRNLANEDEAFAPIISQEFQVPGHRFYRGPAVKQPGTKAAQSQQSQQLPRKRLVLRAKAKTFSERVIDEVNELDVQIKTDNYGTISTHEAGQFAYEPPAGTVRPSVIPQYVSQLNGVPAGPFFMPPKASAKSGYLYMRILGIEQIEDKTDTVYFVIRNGIDTLSTLPVTVGGKNGTTINQEFRILTDPSISITMWMRFRSDAIIYKGGGNMAGSRLGDGGCLPPLLRKLIRRNTRSRNNSRWNCASSNDSVFDFDERQTKYAPGARRDGRAPQAPGFLSQQQHQGVQGGEYPERNSSVFASQTRPGQASEPNVDGGNDQQTLGGYNDPRSLNATQAPSSIFYEPGTERMDHLSSNKGLAQARFKEETRGVAVVH